MAMNQEPRTDRIRRKLDWKFWPTSPVSGNFSALDLHLSSHPELEDQALIAWGFAESEKYQGSKAKVDIYGGFDNNLRWHSNVDDEKLEGFVSKYLLPGGTPESGPASKRSVGFFFVNTISNSNQGWLPGNFHIQPRTLRSLQKAGLSGAILTSMWSPEGVWAKMGNQCFTKHDENEVLSSFEICYRYVCGWDTGAGITQSIRTRNTITYFCINYPSQALDRLQAYLQADPSLAYRDFFLDALCADDSLKQWQIDIGQRRSLLLYHERKYENEDIDFDGATKQLHRLSRDLNTIGQDCRDFDAQLGFLNKTYHKYMNKLQDSKNNWRVDKSRDMGETFEALKSQCDNCARWAVVYRERTNIRINLLFHLANQRESRTNTEIAASTAKVAEQTRRDSASMITIAAVTMFFLPGTFISAILSTTFFEFGDDRLQVSKQWWILPVVTIPLMMVVFAVWLGWHYFKFRIRDGERIRKNV
ncbi:hypothetical protein BS50DRAFT_234525 [Corynespora cassiicola Philippines]|uniref:Uncharacterized protein n=1 Tax=Corynespora cassiicola Philippines TaxID=1448308 RepID=A0A2T2P215_CORCC|nr:hypothetical protein BS50DRAFT_234525 [Corynespora cassiicola Philippines]